ncbi:MAG: hypothetical protein HKP09_02420, partial [Enterobacterales bacterium]|nr:hypothetical protein [Enterobacterales bacterium]
MNIIYKTTFLFLTLACLSANHAEELFTVDRNYTHYTVEDGLPENSVRCLEEDSYGVVWICTGSGLTRFDGYQFEVIVDDIYGNTIRNNIIRDIYIENLKVYFGTEDGLYVLNQSNGQISVISEGADLGFIYTIKSFNQKIYVSTRNGLFELKEDNTAQAILTSRKVRNFIFLDNKLITSETGSGLIEYTLNDDGYLQNRLFEEKSPVVDISVVNEKLMISTHGNGVFILNMDLSIY